MPFNSPAFSSIEGDINECFNKQTELYTYSIGPTRSKEELLPLSAELADTGSMVLEVKSISAQHFEQERVKMTKYIAQGDVGALNREFRGFNDIHFEYNSFHIKEESFGNLDYIAAIFMLDSDFTIRVNGHTCNIGGETFNFRLSQRRAESVMSYLITKGISSKQLIAEGFGDKQPYATNSTEQGREQNRRVEFVIDMDGVKKLSSK
jgi:outer membrane protein OmpA-like peptidoglycan-associated protein